MKAYIVEKDKLKNNIDVVKRKAAGKPIYGVGVSRSINRASVKGVLNAINRSVKEEQ